MSSNKIIEILVRLMIILLINPLHECAHAWSAYKLGDDTAKQAGRMTLSPLAHIDPWGAFLLLFCGFGWAKPVPVNPNKFQNPRKGMMLTAIAGPLSNLLAALAGMTALQCYSGDMETVFYILYYFVMININLCVFNMIPVPPLDGSRVLTYFLPPNMAVWFMRNQKYFYGIVMLLMVTGILSVPLSYAVGWVYQLLYYITKFLVGIL
ncbi:MAG: site-2 protease family protein [Oscillospiraceae bacterium]|nr:site-2 protease family protein [Oscillospiraceae bacterium]